MGWSLPDIWDPIAGNYQAHDGWIRLHTNYAYHRAAVEGLLEASDQDPVQPRSEVEGRRPREPRSSRRAAARR